jgi:hypothetical protein
MGKSKVKSSSSKSFVSPGGKVNVKHGTGTVVCGKGLGKPGSDASSPGSRPAKAC